MKIALLSTFSPQSVTNIYHRYPHLRWIILSEFSSDNWKGRCIHYMEFGEFYFLPSVHQYFFPFYLSFILSQIQNLFFHSKEFYSNSFKHLTCDYTDQHIEPVFSTNYMAFGQPISFSYCPLWPHLQFYPSRFHGSLFQFFFFFLGLHPWYIEIPRLGLNESYHCQHTPQPQQCGIWATSLTYTTALAMPDPWPNERGQGSKLHLHGY